MTKNFFELNNLVMNEISHCAPMDEKLLNIPFHTHAAYSFLKVYIKADEHDKVYSPLISYSLLSFLQSINKTLSVLYATHQYLIADLTRQPATSSTKQK